MSAEDFSFADLRKANFFGADLRGADLSGALFHKADLSGTYFIGATWNEYTVWPEGIGPLAEKES